MKTQSKGQNAATPTRRRPGRSRAARHLPIDHFFRSLAMDLKGKAIGIVLSGTGTDGTLGLKAIKGESASWSIGAGTWCSSTVAPAPAGTSGIRSRAGTQRESTRVEQIARELRHARESLQTAAILERMGLTGAPGAPARPTRTKQALNRTRSSA